MHVDTYPVLLTAARLTRRLIVAMRAHKAQHGAGGFNFMRHRAWEDALFVHWAVDARALQALLPPALEPDRFGGRAYVGLVLLAENGISARLPVISAIEFSHLAANVRTYVRLKSRPELTGIYFFSLDCSSALVTLGARAAFSLPYQLSTMARGATAAPPRDGTAGPGRVEHTFSTVRCRRGCCYRPGTATMHKPGTGSSRRRRQRACSSVSAKWVCTPARPVDSAPGTFAHFAVERYHLFVTGYGLPLGMPGSGLGHAVVLGAAAWGGGDAAGATRGEVFRGTINHAPWELCEAELTHLESTALEAAGLPTPGPATKPIVFAAAQPVTDVDFWLFERVA